MSARYISSYDFKGPHSPYDLGLKFSSICPYEIDGELQFPPTDKEQAFVFLNGQAVVSCRGKAFDVGRLDTVFIPPGIEAFISGAVRFIAYSAPSGAQGEPTLISFQIIDSDPERHSVFGSVEKGNRREVWTILGDGFPADRLMLGICKGSPGGWTAWPPHEHGKQREELYYYFEMENTYGVQLVYEDQDKPELIAMVRDGDLVSIRTGYHPNIGSPAGEISYIYCMTATEPGKRDFMDLTIQEEFKEPFTRVPAEK